MIIYHVAIELPNQSFRMSEQLVHVVFHRIPGVLPTKKVPADSKMMVARWHPMNIMVDTCWHQEGMMFWFAKNNNGAERFAVAQFHLELNPEYKKWHHSCWFFDCFCLAFQNTETSPETVNTPLVSLRIFVPVVAVKDAQCFWKLRNLRAWDIYSERTFVDSLRFRNFFRCKYTDRSR